MPARRRARTPELRRREKTLEAELKSIVDQTENRAAHLRLTETLSTFMARLPSSAQTLDMAERQRIVRLLVKEVLVGDDTITIRHSIPIRQGDTAWPCRRRQDAFGCRPPADGERRKFAFASREYSRRSWQM